MCSVCLVLSSFFFFDVVFGICFGIGVDVCFVVFGNSVWFVVDFELDFCLLMWVSVLMLVLILVLLFLSMFAFGFDVGVDLGFGFDLLILILLLTLVLLLILEFVLCFGF